MATLYFERHGGNVDAATHSTITLYRTEYGVMAQLFFAYWQELGTRPGRNAWDVGPQFRFRTSKGAIAWIRKWRETGKWSRGY